MAGVQMPPRIVFTFADIILTGIASWPPCHIVNSTADAQWEKVNKKKIL
jgi:hypothetical protein